MPHNKKGDHYANPAYGRMMESGAGGNKNDKMMAAYGEKAAQYMKAGYMINKLEIEYAENGFVVKCHWEYPKGDMKKMKNGESTMMSYMEPTVKVFENVKDMTSFVEYAFNAYRHGGTHMKETHSSHGSSHGSHAGLSYPGENGRQPKAKKGNPHY